MLKAYQVIKLLIGVILGCMLTLAVFYEVTDRLKLDYFSQDTPEGAINIYNGIKSFIFYDPYYQSVLSKVNRSVDEFQSYFLNLSEQMNHLSTNKEFLNALFILQVSKKSDAMEHLIRSQAGSNPIFLDFIITDPAKAVIYKFGDSPYSADYTVMENNQVIKPYEGTIAIIQDYQDVMLETKLNLTAILNTNGVQTQLKNLGYSAIYYMNNLLYKNSLTFPNVVNKMKQGATSRQKFSTGLSVVEFYPVTVRSIVIGVLAVNYPARSLGSSLLMLVKVILGLILVLGWILVDRTIEKSLVKSAAWKKTIQNQPQSGRSGNTSRESDQSPETEKSLDWFQHYIEGSEEKK